MSAGVFTVLHAVLLTPPPYPDPERLVVLWSEVRAEGVREGTSAYANVQDWKARSTVFEHLAVWDPITLTLAGPDASERVSVARVSPDLFDALRTAPLVGRMFTSDEAVGGEAVAVASRAFASERFGDARAALGQVVTLDGRSFEVVGVMPADFAYPGADTRLWLPHTHFTTGAAEGAGRGTGAWRVVGRLREEATLEVARMELEAVAAELEQEYRDNAGLGVRIVGLHQQQTGESNRVALWALFGAAGLVLLIACANSAHLAMIRSLERSGDRAIRTALGASRSQLIRQALAENLAVALLGGLFGAGLATGGVELLTSIAPPNLFPADVHVGVATLFYVAGLSVAIGVIFGVAPALRPTRRLEIAGGARVTSLGAGTHGPRRFLIAGQIGLALLLVFGATLLARSALASGTTDPGFQPEGVVMANLSVPAPEARLAFYEGVVGRITRLQGVRAAGIIEDLFIGGAPNVAISVEGAPTASASRVALRVDAVAGDVFIAIGAPLVAGRFFGSGDGAGAAPVAIVNETMASRFWPGESAVGRRFRTGDTSSGAEWIEVVGVVGDMRRQGVELEPIAQVFRPYAQAPSRNMNLLVRSDVAPDTLFALLRAEVAALDRTIPLYGLTTVPDGMDRYVAQRRLQTFLVGLFSSVALLLAVVGIYGVLNYSVSRRGQEIGVRIALGARSSDVVRMILREGLMLAVPGIALGLLGALWLSESIALLLYRVTPTDPTSVAFTGLALVAATMLASYVPARRAARFDAVRALRGD
jgi:predicted permease